MGVCEKLDIVAVKERFICSQVCTVWVYIYSRYALFGFIFTRGMHCLLFFQFLPRSITCSLSQIFLAIGKHLWGKKINEIRMMKQYKGGDVN